jgi:hypothetical protein
LTNLPTLSARELLKDLSIFCFSFEFNEHGIVIVSSSSTIPLRILSPFLTSSEIPFNLLCIPFCFSPPGLPFAEPTNFKEIISSTSC